MEGAGLIIVIILLWVLPSLLIALTGSNKNLGYWGVFFISIFFSPVVGLICGVASSRKEKKQKAPVQSWKCTKCGQSFTGMPDACKNCGQPMNYPESAYEKIKYTCTSCKKFFFGRKSACPHCDTKMNYGGAPLPEKKKQLEGDVPKNEKSA